MFEWRYLFADVILQRAANIAKDAINIESIDDGGLTATVCGTDLYTITIDKDFSSMSCSCPCGFNCKHLAAVLMECESHKGDALAEFYAHSEVSKLAMIALNNKLHVTEKRLELEKKEAARLKKLAEQAEKKRQFELDAPRRAAEKVERERPAAICREEREKREEEAKKKREERERIRAEKEKAEAERRAKAAEEPKRREIEWRNEMEKRAKKEEEVRIIQSIIAAERAEEERQAQLDKEARKAIRQLSKEDRAKLQTQLRELDEQIEALERAERPEPYPEMDEELANLLSMDDRGWLYSDSDPLDGVIYEDKYHKSFYIPDGYRPWYGDDDGYTMTIPKIEVGEGLEDESDDDDDE